MWLPVMTYKNDHDHESSFTWVVVGTKQWCNAQTINKFSFELFQNIYKIKKNSCSLI